MRYYFTVPGDYTLVLLDQLLKNPRQQLIGCCNELNAGYAAEGYARSNRIGAFVVTYSVGGLSALNAVACAYAEDLPGHRDLGWGQHRRGGGRARSTRKCFDDVETSFFPVRTAPFGDWERVIVDKLAKKPLRQRAAPDPWQLH